MFYITDPPMMFQFLFNITMQCNNTTAIYSKIHDIVMHKSVIVKKFQYRTNVIHMFINFSACLMYAERPSSFKSSSHLFTALLTQAARILLNSFLKFCSSVMVR